MSFVSLGKSHDSHFRQCPPSHSRLQFFFDTEYLQKIMVAGSSVPVLAFGAEISPCGSNPCVYLYVGERARERVQEEVQHT